MYQLYIGANNVTKLVEVDRIVTRVSEFYKGFTIARTLGYWEGQAEDSVVVTLFSNDDETLAVETIARDLCSILNQNSILVNNNGIGKLVFAVTE